MAVKAKKNNLQLLHFYRFPIQGDRFSHGWRCSQCTNTAHVQIFQRDRLLARMEMLKVQNLPVLLGVRWVSTILRVHSCSHSTKKFWILPNPQEWNLFILIKWSTPKFGLPSANQLTNPEEQQSVFSFLIYFLLLFWHKWNTFQYRLQSVIDG